MGIRLSGYMWVGGGRGRGRGGGGMGLKGNMGIGLEEEEEKEDWRGGGEEKRREGICKKSNNPNLKGGE